MLQEIVPSVRGRLQTNCQMSKHTWFQVGGNATALYKPADFKDLSCFLGNYKGKTFVIGGGSNLLVRDGGMEELVIKLGPSFSKIEVINNEIAVGAACLDRNLSLFALEHGFGGFEFYIGIPGWIGGAVFMNAGAYSGETADLLQWVEIIDRDGYLHRLNASELQFEYRKSNLPSDCVIIKAGFKIIPDKTELIQRKIAENLEKKKQTQPMQGRTGGSTFKNPPGLSAWQLIDSVGYRGKQLGGAIVSPLHCNFLINRGDAKASDLENLGLAIIAEVFKQKKVSLEWEIIRIGLPVEGK